MKTFVLLLNAKYDVMVINAENEEEAIRIATAKNVKINPLYSCNEDQICEVHEVIVGEKGIQYYG